MFSNLKKQFQEKSLYILSSLLALFIFIPLLWAFRLSIQESYSTFVSIIPSTEEFTLNPYISLLKDKLFLRWILNSIIFAGGVTIMNLIISPMAGYALAKKRIPGHEFLFLFILALWVIPFQVTLIPLYIGLSKVGLTNTYLGLILPLAVDPLAIFLMRQYMIGIPDVYEEAALLDGCSKFQSFFKVILPMAKPGLMVVAVTIFMFTWGNLIFPLVLTNTDSMKVLTVGIAEFSYGDLQDWGRTMAGSLIGAIPTILLFIVLNKYFMKGIIIGEGTKG